MTDHKKNLIDRFLRYIKVYSPADQNSKTVPSHAGQLEMSKMWAEDLRSAGVTNIECTEQGIVYATIPGNVKGVPTIGFLSHVDVSFDSPSKDIKVRFIENYQGGDITYPANPNIKLTYENSPTLKKCIGHTIITTDGTTLLSGDDKAGLSVLVELAKYFKENPNEPHGDIRIAAITDEEIGVGTERLDLKKFGCDVAYTVDGGGLGEYDDESFNGFMGKVTVDGVPAFPGYGKGMFLSSQQVAAKFISLMDDKFWPQNCDGRQPIWWVNDIKGDLAKTEFPVFLRSFDLRDIDEFKKILNGIKDKVLKEYPTAKIDVNVNETYLNYKLDLDKDPRVVKYAVEAMKRIGITPISHCVRGGNDSCHLCKMGLVSTNLFIGMQHMHSVMEWNTVETIEGAFKTCISLAKVWSETKK